MLEFFKDGKTIRILGIYSEGKVGQAVIYGQKVDWGPNVSPTLRPLSQYPAPSIFIIVETEGDRNGYYTLKDSNGKCFKLDKSKDSGYLYDAQEWLTWKDMHEKEKLTRKQNKIELLESHISLLKDILIKQGIHIVTKEQAKDLDL